MNNMNKVIKYLAVILISIFVIACTKEQQTINKLEGVWELESERQYTDGTTLVSETIVGANTRKMILTFEDYKPKKDEFGMLELKFVNEKGEVDELLEGGYEFLDKSATFIFIVTPNQNRLVEITELTKTSLTLITEFDDAKEGEVDREEWVFKKK